MAEAKQKKKKKTPNKGVAAMILTLLGIIMAMFVVLVVRLNVLPDKYVWIMVGVFAVLLLVEYLLLHHFKTSIRCVLGAILALLLSGGLIFGGYMLNRTQTALNDITTVREEVTEMVVYVRSEDAASTIAETANYDYGIMTSLNREVTDQAVSDLQIQLNTTLKTQEFDGPDTLVSALLEDKVDAILLNQAYIALLSEIEGFESVSSQVKQLTTLRVTTTVVVPVAETEDESSKTDSGTEDDSAKEEGENSANAGEHQDVFTIYITGIDTYGSISTVSRSDVNILATVNTTTHQVVLVSTPRDYYVQLPNSGGAYDKLTHAGIYGVSCSMGALEMLYDIDVDYYFRVNFTGFKDIIDALGGITVYSDATFASGGYQFYEGENFMYGDAALSFARNRYSFADGDRARGRHQMAVIKAVINKLTSPEILMSYTNILDAIEGDFETSIPYSLLSSLVKEQLDTGAEWNIVSYSVDGWGDYRVPWSFGVNLNAYVMIPYEETVATAKELMRQVRDGEVVSLP